MTAARVRRMAIFVVLGLLVVVVAVRISGVLDDPAWVRCATSKTNREVAAVETIDPPVTLETVRHAEVTLAVDAAQDPTRGDWWVSVKTGELIHFSEDFSERETAMTLPVSLGYEQGAFGLVVDAAGEFLYVAYSAADWSVEVIALELDDDGLASDEGRIIISVDEPRDTHNGGDLVIDDDGYLWIGLGDGGGATGKLSPIGRWLQGGEDHLASNAQDTSNLLGSLLRIEPTPRSDDPYAIPDDNPFVGVEGARDEIWSYGLRNPWQVSIDEVTGDLWIGDVGQKCWEEIDVARAGDGSGAGTNFGWGHYEGQHIFDGGELEDSVLPPIALSHDDGYCTLIGGAVYRGGAIPELDGWYLFSDTCLGQVMGAREASDGTWQLTDLGANVPAVVGFTIGADGEMYATSMGGGVYQLVAA